MRSYDMLALYAMCAMYATYALPEAIQPEGLVLLTCSHLRQQNPLSALHTPATTPISTSVSIPVPTACTTCSGGRGVPARNRLIDKRHWDLCLLSNLRHSTPAPAAAAAWRKLHRRAWPGCCLILVWLLRRLEDELLWSGRLMMVGRRGLVVMMEVMMVLLLLLLLRWWRWWWLLWLLMMMMVVVMMKRWRCRRRRWWWRKGWRRLRCSGVQTACMGENTRAGRPRDGLWRRRRDRLTWTLGDHMCCWRLVRGWWRWSGHGWWRNGLRMTIGVRIDRRWRYARRRRDRWRVLLLPLLTWHRSKIGCLS